MRVIERLDCGLGGGSSHAGAIAMAMKDHNSVWQPSHLLICE
jgi:4-diphosphocytidyl-2C-methyl-D-erythritol kinase